MRLLGDGFTAILDRLVDDNLPFIVAYVSLFLYQLCYNNSSPSRS